MGTFVASYMRKRVQQTIASALDGRFTSNFELDFETKSGSIRHLSVSASTRRNARNKIVGVLVRAHDVTDAVVRDRSVSGLEEIDTANIPICGTDVVGNINEWNGRTQEITGYSKEDAFGKPLVESFVAPELQQKVQEVLDAALQGDEISNYELEFISKSGKICFLSVNATARRDPAGRVVGGKNRWMSFTFAAHM